MKLQARASRLVICGIALLFGALAAPGLSQDEEIQSLEKQLTPLEKVVSDPLAGPKEYAAVKGKLLQLLARTDALLEKSRRFEEDDALTKLHTRALAALKTVNSRLPAKPQVRVRSGLPVPAYDPDKRLGQAAAALRDAQFALAQQLRAAPDDDAQTNRLLTAVILAQEELAWEAGWPFSSGESEAFKKAGKLTAEVYHARRKRGVAQINEQLASDAGSVGRDTPRAFVIHCPEDKAVYDDVSKTLSQLRGNIGGTCLKGTQPFNNQERDALLGLEPPKKKVEPKKKTSR